MRGRWFTAPALLVMAALLLAGLSPLASVSAQAGIEVTTTADARLRSGPGTEWRTITVLATGTPLRIDGAAPGSYWIRGIAPLGEVGWLAAELTTITAEQLAALPQIWVDTPFSLAAPEGGAPAAPAAPAAAPATAAPAPLVNAPPPSSARGFAYGGHVADFSTYASDQMARAGMTWVKRQWRYVLGQNPADAAGWINDAHARGFRILLGVIGEPSQVYTPGYFDQYAAFLGGLAALGADAIEVWNEPNLNREWPDGQINPASYTELLRVSYNAIRAANPATLVISGAPAPTGFFGGCTGSGCDDNLFIQGMAAAGAANYMDCIGIHYNEGILPPTQNSGDPRGASSHYSRYFNGMINTYWRAFGGARPLCFTEIGYLSPEGYGPLPPGFEWASNTTVTQQAQWLDSAISLAARSGRVRLFIIWNIDFTLYGADPQAGYAIIRPGGGCPACDLLAN
jgi:hypothetical protein